MSLEELSWGDGHHRSSFMPSLGAMTDCLERYATQVSNPPLQMPILTHEVFSEGNPRIVEDSHDHLPPEPPPWSSSEHSSSSCVKLLKQ